MQNLDWNSDLSHYIFYDFTIIHSYIDCNIIPTTDTTTI
jgi:hypothetical protein